MFTFDVSPHDLFDERRKQFVAWGIPKATVHRVVAKIVDTWKNAPGGWTYEWNQEAQKAKAHKHWMLAASLFGAARFPCLTTPDRQEALEKQVNCFIIASKYFPLQFDRQFIDCRVNELSVRIPIHVYAPKNEEPLPTVLLSGGVDTGKIELHRLAMVLCKFANVRVVAMDMPGTGESDTPLTKDADALYKKVLQNFRELGKVGILGVSFGGHWAAKLALQREVDAAVNFGGPIGVNGMDSTWIRSLPYGMPGIVANVMRYAAYADEAWADSILRDFGMASQGLLNTDDCAPILVVNGSADPYVPVCDVDIFRRYPSADVWLLRGLSHCAAERIHWVIPGIITWLRKELHAKCWKNQVLHGVAQMLLPRRY